jgi:hypothetical protein
LPLLLVAKPSRSRSARAFATTRSSPAASRDYQKGFDAGKLLSSATSVRARIGSAAIS